MKIECPENKYKSINDLWFNQLWFNQLTEPRGSIIVLVAILKNIELMQYNLNLWTLYNLNNNNFL